MSPPTTAGFDHVAVSRDRLYGTPDAEYLDLDLASAYERWEADLILDDGEPRPDCTIEEWTTAPVTVPANAVATVVEELCERMADDGDEGYYDSWMDAANHDDVRLAFQAAADLLASKVTYRMADRLVATHGITHDDEGEPMLNGERLYRKVDG